jgi:8-oxo-dGTP pyrophosphatase MutT (NUDIX family)
MRVVGGDAFLHELELRLAARTVARLDDARLRPSAVLVPLFVGVEDEPHVVFTRRVETLASHAGQVSFPGGSRDPEDRDELATALRECEEELGLPPTNVRPLGRLDDVPVITGFKITPWIGRIPAGFGYRPSSSEVARVFEVPLAALVDPERTRFRIEHREWWGHTHEVPFFEHGGEVIWGATGRILLQLLEVAFGFRPPGAS